MRVFSFALVGVALSAATVVWAQAPARKAPPATQKQAAPAPSRVERTAPSAAAMAITMPPIPSPGFPPGRPVATARAVYEFAARHPEILKYVPCYCGCESTGHGHNESCFVKRRDAKGNVLEWDTHGYG